MILFDFCTAETVWVDVAERERLQQALKAKKLEDFLDQAEQIFVFVDGDEAVGIADEDQALHGEMSETCFMLGPSMFYQARDYFYERQQTGERVYVLDNSARVVGSVYYRMNYIDTNWQMPNGYWDYDFKHDPVNEDLLNKADGYVFRSLEEYSYAIAQYLSDHHPERPIYFWDPDGTWSSLSDLWRGRSACGSGMALYRLCHASYGKLDGGVHSPDLQFDQSDVLDDLGGTNGTSRPALS